MHLILTDRLTCPRCGPEFGLILLAERMGEERRVLDGVLGCANCRDRFPVRDGFGDLRAPPRNDLPDGRAGTTPSDDEEAAGRVRALLGLVEGPGTVLAAGAAARHAPLLARLVEGIETVAVDPDARHWGEMPGVSRLAARPGIPVAARALRGVVVDGALGRGWIEEAARAVAHGGRVLVEDAGADAGAVLEASGLRILAVEAGTVVAARG